ncbi:MAG TPA: hypothetical protein VE687_16540, partial [Stellaceae bacterium]|nr:hypothetical protein [Stellaceae bacterium]
KNLGKDLYAVHKIEILFAAVPRCSWPLFPCCYLVGIDGRTRGFLRDALTSALFFVGITAESAKWGRSRTPPPAAAVV